MKSLIVLAVALLVAGCGKSKSLTEEEKLVGSYEAKGFGDTVKFVFLENGEFESYQNGRKLTEGTWEILGKEVFAKGENSSLVFKTTTNGDLILIAGINEGKREDRPKIEQLTFRKINADGKTSVKELTVEEKKVVGEYERKDDGDTFKWVFLENGHIKLYSDGEKADESIWIIVNKEIHIRAKHGSGILVFRINKDRSITEIAFIDDGKREELPKEDQMTLKRIK